MKTKLAIYIILFLVTSVSSFAQTTVKKTIKVYGNCVMCKNRIESALDKTGIKTAQWDPQTKNLEVVYNSRKITEKQIHETIAAAGHDTDVVKAKDDTYAELPYCCLYRDHDHSGIKDDKDGHPHD